MRKATYEEFDYLNEFKDMFSNENYEIFKIHYTWNTQVSLLYAVISQTALLKNKLNSLNKYNNIKSNITKNWNTKDSKLHTIKIFNYNLFYINSFS